MIASKRVRSFEELPAREIAARVVRDVAPVALVLLFSMTAMGCSNLPFFRKSQPPVTQRELPKTQTAPAGGSAPETLRDDTARRAPAQPAPEPPRTVQPIPTQEAPQPQPAAAPAELSPAQNSADPDARAVIDWLLKDRR